MQRIAALLLTFVIAHAKPALYLPESANYVSVKPKGLPSACEIYCPARPVCDRCWRGRCDYEGQEQLWLGCAQALFYNERILQGASYKDAKQKATTAAVAVAAAAAMNQSDSLEGFGRNKYGGATSTPKNKSLVIIQNDKASRVILTDESLEVPSLRGFSTKPKKNSQVMSYNPNLIPLPPPSAEMKKRFGHLPDIVPPVGAIVDQRVWIPVQHTQSEEVEPKVAAKVVEPVAKPQVAPVVIAKTEHPAPRVPPVQIPHVEVAAAEVPVQSVESLEGSTVRQHEESEEKEILDEMMVTPPEASDEAEIPEVYPVAIANIASRNATNNSGVLRRGGLVANLLRPAPRP